MNAKVSNATEGQSVASATRRIMDAMVNRFLSWNLPKDFQPDGGVTFTPSKTHPESWPVGTNLLTAVQAEAMLAHVTGPLQAELDRLMLEFCPEEMDEAQKANWAKHQRAATPEEEAAVQSALSQYRPMEAPQGLPVVNSARLPASDAGGSETTMPGCSSSGVIDSAQQPAAASALSSIERGDAIAKLEQRIDATVMECNREGYTRKGSDLQMKLDGLREALGIILGTRSAIAPRDDGQDITRLEIQDDKADNLGVDRFMVAMKAKLEQKRLEGYYGWNYDCTIEHLEKLLEKHIDKPWEARNLVDIANFCMMLWNREHPTGSATDSGGA